MRVSAMFLAIGGIVVSLTWDVRAELIEFEFSGQVEYLYQGVEVPHRWANVKVGDSWSLRYTFDSTTPAYPGTGDTTADYYSAIKSYTLRVGNVYLTSRSPDPGLIEVMNDGYWDDSYTAATGLSDGGWISMYLGGPVTVWDSVALPLCGDIELDSFTKWAFCSIYVPDASGSFQNYITGSITAHVCGTKSRPSR
jgi:hypothetical protein